MLELRKYIYRGFYNALAHIEREVKANFGRPRPNVITGRLKRSITAVTFIRGGDVFEGFIQSKVPYARIQEEGGTITAGAGEYIRFKGSDGSWVQTTEVNIPARPYIRPEIEGNVELVKEYVLRSVSKGNANKIFSKGESK